MASKASDGGNHRHAQVEVGSASTSIECVLQPVPEGVEAFEGQVERTTQDR